MKKLINLILLLILTTNLTAKEFSFPSADFIESKKDEFASKVIIMDSNFEKVRDLKNNKKLFNTARRIASLVLIYKNKPVSFCSGSLVGPDLILTNHHCLYPLEELIDINLININMEYLQDNQVGNFTAQAIEVVKKNKELDYALIRLDKKIGQHYGWLELADSTPNKGDVMIIQHPQGRSKEVSRVSSNIIRNNNGLLHYFADTQGGSSGSPVFNLKGTKIIALHHVGACRRESSDPDDKTCSSSSYNEGIVIGRIKKEIAQYLPSCAIDGDFPGKFVNKCVYLTE